jgi:hypothetical protein
MNPCGPPASAPTGRASSRRHGTASSVSGTPRAVFAWAADDSIAAQRFGTWGYDLTARADLAVNYGGIGATTIGHEMTHGFDDAGRQYNGDDVL